MKPLLKALPERLVRSQGSELSFFERPVLIMLYFTLLYFTFVFIYVFVFAAKMENVLLDEWEGGGTGYYMIGEIPEVT